jgi:hypothetical protein
VAGRNRRLYPDWVEIKFKGTKTIDRVVVYTLQDDNRYPIEPTDGMTFSADGIVDFSVQARRRGLGLRSGVSATTIWSSVRLPLRPLRPTGFASM